MPGVDLHLHSTASDGRFSPAELVRKAAEKDLSVIALSDHDSVDGIIPAIEAVKAYPELQIIPAVEISTDVPQGEVHILGYFIDYSLHELKIALEKLRLSRVERARGMVEKLEDLDIHVAWERVKEIAGSGSIGRPHIAQAMLEKGYIGSIKEAFTRYIGHDGPAYVERRKMDPLEAIGLVIRADGLPVLAHPLTANNPETLVAELKEAGLVGIEVYYDGFSAEERKWLEGLAERYDLIATGGSDYHGLDDSNETMMGDAGVPFEVVQRLIERKRELKPVSRE